MIDAAVSGSRLVGKPELGRGAGMAWIVVVKSPSHKKTFCVLPTKVVNDNGRLLQ
jgi:hypothetical protein